MLLPIYKVEEGEYVEDHLHPTLPLAPPHYVHVEDGGGVVQARSTHNRAVDISTEMSRDHIQ